MLKVNFIPREALCPLGQRMIYLPWQEPCPGSEVFSVQAPGELTWKTVMWVPFLTGELSPARSQDVGPKGKN